MNETKCSMNERGKTMNSKFKPETISLGITDRCCDGTTGCEWDRTLRNVKAEPIYTQKVYDATLVNLQALTTINNVRFTPCLGRGARIVRVLDIRCRRFFNPGNICDPRNLTVEPKTSLSGGQFVKDGKGHPVEVVGPDGFMSEKIIYADTGECDAEGRGTPVFGSQRVKVCGNVIIEIDVVIQTSSSRRRTVTLAANVPITPVELTNFFELCVPSVFGGAFFPRFTEFCNILCETRLATNSIGRDISIDQETGEVKIDLVIAICIACEKKVIVPVQLCVLSTGFPELSPEISPVCTTFPGLFPRQIDENASNDPPACNPRPHLSLSIDDDPDMY